MHLLHLLLINQKRDKTLIIDALLQQLGVFKSMVQTRHAVTQFHSQNRSVIAYVILSKHLYGGWLDKLPRHH